MASTLSTARVQKERERLEAAHKAGSISAKDYKESIKALDAAVAFMGSLPSRESKNTVDSLREYCKGLPEAEQNKALRCAEILDREILTLRGILKEVRVDRDGKRCKVFPRWFLNTPEVGAKEQGVEPQKKGKGKRSRKGSSAPAPEQEAAPESAESTPEAAPEAAPESA